MAQNVSLYIPCYNAGKYIEKCLDGATKQTYPISEILLIDDGSTDDTVSKALRYNVKIIRHGNNKGLAAARNTAMMNSSGFYLASLDADCVASPEWLEKLMSNFTDEKVAGVGGKLIERENTRIADRWRAVYMRQNWGDLRNADPRFLFGSNNVFRKSALMGVGGYNVIYRTNGEDHDMSLRLKSAGYRFVYEPEAVVEHLRTDTVRSVLHTHWRWTFIGTTGTRRVPDNLYNLVCKTYDNLAYLFKDMLMNDIKNGRAEFLIVDIFSWFHHFFCDAAYYLSSKLGQSQKMVSGAKP
jgi:cellulose synthase/poly-beta-1,6-N-acetylglucosamine synthase-like glycosyltransferase